MQPHAHAVIPRRRIKIAVLDTGLRPDHPLAEQVEYKDFVDLSATQKKDKAEHGTEMVDFILKVYEDASLFIARVFETQYANETTHPKSMAEVCSRPFYSFSSAYLRRRSNGPQNMEST